MTARVPLGRMSSGDEARRDDARGIEESLRELGSTGRATWDAGRDAAKAFRILLSADISLARSAFGRTLAFTGVAIAFGASAWLLLMAALIAWLSLGLGWPWALSLLLAAGLLVYAAGYVAMSRHVRNAGAFYAYIARGLGPEAGVGSAWTALVAYNAMQIGIYGMLGFATSSFVAPSA